MLLDDFDSETAAIALEQLDVLRISGRLACQLRTVGIDALRWHSFAHSMCAVDIELPAAPRTQPRREQDVCGLDFRGRRRARPDVSVRPRDRNQTPFVHQFGTSPPVHFSFLPNDLKLGVTLSGKLCRLRSYRHGDEAAICAVADDYMVARWMTRAFPHPYTTTDAEHWIAMACRDGTHSHFAIEVQGVLAGGIGFDLFGGERTGTASFGYWLGRAYWRRGIATEAAQMLADYALHTSGLRRLEAKVFEPNVASARVLQKAGFSLEGVLRSAYVDRDDKVCDALLFARTTTKKADSVNAASPTR